MPLHLAARAGLIEPSATLAMGAEARRLKAQGLEIFDFALGEPDFATPANAASGGIERVGKAAQLIEILVRDHSLRPRHERGLEALIAEVLGGEPPFRRPSAPPSLLTCTSST